MSLEKKGGERKATSFPSLVGPHPIKKKGKKRRDQPGRYYTFLSEKK